MTNSSTIKSFGKFFHKNRSYLYRKIRIYYYWKMGLSSSEIGKIFGLDRRYVHQIIKWAKNYSAILDQYNKEDIKNAVTFYSICRRIYSNKAK